MSERADNLNLARVQFLSLATKAVTTLFGIIQSIIVIRLLGPAQFGLAGLVMSIGSVVGVAQHLGVVDGAIREIAVLKDKAEAGKVFWVSHLVRQLVTLPLTVLLISLAGVICARVYGRPELAPYLMIFAASLVLQGLQDVLGATLTGLQRFGGLYVVQIITAAVNVAVFGYFTWQFGLSGFFWAIIATTAIMVFLLGWLCARNLAGHLQRPRRADIRRYGRRVMRIGAYMYVARIFFVVWQRLPLLVLGATLSADQLGYLNVSQTFGSRLTIIAMALSEVNLSWMSSLFVRERDAFVQAVTRNMQRVLVLMTGLALSLLFFAPEILRYAAGAEFVPAHRIVLVVTAAFYLYALMDIGTSSVFVPADKPRTRAGLYGVMMSITALLLLWLLWLKPEPFLAGAAVLAGAIVSYAAMVLLAWRHFRVPLLPRQLAAFLGLLGLSVVWLLAEPALAWRVLIFALLAVYILVEAGRQQLLPVRTFFLARAKEKERGDMNVRIVCFAGAAWEAPAWTNRQHIMWRVAQHYPVLYVEPRVWIVRYLWQHRRQPKKLLRFWQRLAGYERVHDNLFITSQWNLLPGSREYRSVARFNHWLNSGSVVRTARRLGFLSGKLVLWLYDTEAAEYLAAFPRATILYDCVDDHAAQAGVDRNPARVREEEAAIMARADLVTVTSRRLFELKKGKAKSVELVLNAGDVAAFSAPAGGPPPDMADILPPRLGTVGALDAYKFDFNLLAAAAKARPQWQFVFIGAPAVEQRNPELTALAALPNVHVLGPRERQYVPAYVQHFEVCLIPYRDSRYNEASFPLKFWEFMATGKPVVAAGVPELRAYRELISYAESAEEFIAEIERALRSPELSREARAALAQEHSWEKRTERLLALLAEIV
ncbi:MAG: hypothetical protein COT71_01240 [Candidatus Andersenbacteria bacterium CG10_big_fil_rev_8_21_14_0_10_54_11]|uniref:Polysaccharide biosynthesis protein C-terminal domain-containing protein n=1 Tax=Candidatus Andersenbacteria bacterium CG10_big_fil_rev_8_21_14_0_10_54_11 TaxID=1974485 RepID=A0A2M6WZU8_9BACT|nr:MAG: hypothetical protein COT71_01240 [Candidatus Andersenbacteria bacterium CG10_big_fil_rev_8_21_14_0_10_54_11]